MLSDKQYESRHAARLSCGSWIWYSIGKDAAGEGDWSPLGANVYVHCSEAASLRTHYLSGRYSVEGLLKLIDEQTRAAPNEALLLETLKRALRDLRGSTYRPSLPSVHP